VRASFLPGPGNRVAEKLERFKLHEFDLESGAVLETGCVYIVPILERLKLPANIAASANLPALVMALCTGPYGRSPDIHADNDDEMLGSPWKDLPDEFRAADQALVDRGSRDIEAWLYVCGDSITAIDGRFLRGLNIDPDDVAYGKARRGWSLTPLQFGDDVLIMCTRPNRDDRRQDTARVLSLAMEVSDGLGAHPYAGPLGLRL